MKFFNAFVIFDISLSSHAVTLSSLILVSTLISFVAALEALTTLPPTSCANVLNPQSYGDFSTALSLPTFAFTSGGVYGINSVCLNALNLLLFNLSLTNVCRNKVPNITGCCASAPSRKNPTTTSPP